MVLFDFYCVDCDNKEERDFDSFESFQAIKDSKDLKCTKCNGELRRDFSAGTTAKVHIPDHMKAGTDGANNFEAANHYMKRGKRPSGKDRVFY